MFSVHQFLGKQPILKIVHRVCIRNLLNRMSFNFMLGIIHKILLPSLSVMIR